MHVIAQQVTINSSIIILKLIIFTLVDIFFADSSTNNINSLVIFVAILQKLVLVYEY